jgi:hypothetical protein
VLFYTGKTVQLLLNNLLLLMFAVVLAPLLASQGPVAVSWLLALCFTGLAPITYSWARKLMPIKFEIRTLLVPAIGVLGCAAIAIYSWIVGLQVATPVWWWLRLSGGMLLAATCTAPLHRLFAHRERR